MEVVTEKAAFPRLTEGEMALVRERGTARGYRDGEPVIAAGEREIGLVVIERGKIEVLDPSREGEGPDKEVLAVHEAGEFLGDVDVLTGRPVVFKAIARGGNVRVIEVGADRIQGLLAGAPRLGEKLLLAFQLRREMGKEKGVKGHRVVGTRTDADATALQEFLFKNFVPFTFLDSDTDEGRAAMEELAITCDDLPAMECVAGGGRGNVLKRPTVRDVAKCVGVVRLCPERVYDLAIVGAGPAGMTAAVYAASEGLSVVVLDRVGPGGQASGTSMIENFIGFPSGLSGNDLAARGYLQMLKFGALLVVPVAVTGLRVEGAHKILETDDVPVRARVVLAATGAKWRKLEARGARQYERNGIYYSATAVENRLCVGKEVAVIGAGNSGGQAAMYLSECAPKVYLIVHSDSMEKGMSAYLYERVRANPKIEVIFNGEITEVHGDRTPADEPRLTGVTVKDCVSGNERKLDVVALFAFIGAEPRADFVPAGAGGAERDAKGYLLTGHRAASSGKWPLKDRMPCELETTMPGVLAAGDVRAGSTKRVGFAVGDGSLAVTCVHALLRERQA